MFMNIQSSLLPHKHVRFCDSIIGIAGLVRSLLTEPMTVDEIWAALHQRAFYWPSTPTFTSILLGIYVLFALGQIELLENGRLRVLVDETE